MHVLPRQAENLAELAKRGAPIGTRSRLVGVQCVECGHDYLYDEHANVLLLDAASPDDVWDVDTEPVPCRGCGALQWVFEDVDPADEAFVHGPWSYAFWSPQPPRTRSPLLRAVAVGTLAVLAFVGAIAVSLNPDPFAPPGQVRPVLDGGR